MVQNGKFIVQKYQTRGVHIKLLNKMIVFIDDVISTHHQQHQAPVSCVLLIK